MTALVTKWSRDETLEPAKVVSERLGHSSVSFTLDTYAHVMPGQQAEAAAAAVALVDR